MWFERNRKLGGALVATCVVAVFVLPACGGSDGDGESREEALAALALTSEATTLKSQMGKLVARLNAEPSAAERKRLKLRLRALDRRAAMLIASADTDSTFDVKLKSLGKSTSTGKATLAESNGQLAIDAEFRDLPGGRHMVTVNALKPGEGASVCPPSGAASGGDKKLTSGEAEDFYGEPAASFGPVKGKAEKVTLVSTKPAAGSAPVAARSVVISGGGAPLACGIPDVAPPSGEPTPSVAAVGALNDTRAAGYDLVTVVNDPTTKPAQRAQRSAARHLLGATIRLENARALTLAQLNEEGEELTAAERQTLEQVSEDLENTQKVTKEAFVALKKDVVQVKRERQRRIAQRLAAQREAREAAAAAAAAAAVPTEPAPSYIPAPSYTPAPAPAPTPAPAPSGGGGGPSVTAPG